MVSASGGELTSSIPSLSELVESSSSISSRAMSSSAAVLLGGRTPSGGCCGAASPSGCCGAASPQPKAHRNFFCDSWLGLRLGLGSVVSGKGQ